MAIANLHETLLSYTQRKNALNLEISNLQTTKQLAIAEQADAQSLQNSEKRELREFWKNAYNNDPELREKYISYTEIEDFEEAIEQAAAKYQDQLDELTAWETSIDAELTTKSAELEEIKAYQESIKSMLSTNIQEDFNYGLQ